MLRFIALGLLTLTAFSLRGEETPRPESPAPGHVWVEDFTHPAPAAANGTVLPENWAVEGLKLGVPATICTITGNADGQIVLRVSCQKSTGGIICDPKQMARIDLRKTPILRWRWRVLSYPDGADGRNAKKDDQPIAIYVGISSGFGKKTLAYRWEGLTPVGLEGTVKYGGGIVAVHYVVLRNQETPAGEWHTETRNLAEDFQRIYGKIPNEFTISVMANSQYTKSNSAAEIAFLEFLPEN